MRLPRRKLFRRGTHVRNEREKAAGRQKLSACVFLYPFSRKIEACPVLISLILQKNIFFFLFAELQTNVCNIFSDVL